MEARTPAEGSIPQGYLPYGIPNTNDGYEMAGSLLTNPSHVNDEIIAEGKEIYTKYCLHCHGKEGSRRWTYGYARVVIHRPQLITASFEESS